MLLNTLSFSVPLLFVAKHSHKGILQYLVVIDTGQIQLKHKTQLYRFVCLLGKSTILQMIY